MPIYEYRCAKCGFQDEYLQKASERPLKVCPSCGKAKFKKLLSAPGFHLKGSGWYATDFKGAGKPAKSDAKGEAKGEVKGDAKGEAKAESKADGNSEAKSDAAKPAKPVKSPASTTN